MPHVIPDPIRNPGRHSGEGRNKQRIAALGSRSGTGLRCNDYLFSYKHETGAGHAAC